MSVYSLKVCIGGSFLEKMYTVEIGYRAKETSI